MPPILFARRNSAATQFTDNPEAFQSMIGTTASNQSLKGTSMADEKQARLEARARIDIRKLYDKGQITLKDHASAVGYLRGVWFDHLSDFEIEDFICREIRKLESSTIQPVE